MGATIQILLIGILGIAILALMMMFSKGKKNSNKHFYDLENKLTDYFETIKQTQKESIDKNNADLNKKIEVLATALEQLSKENAELRKKLEFFTEIGEDSKNINETEDADERDALINQAIAELSSSNTASQSSEGGQSVSDNHEDNDSRIVGRGTGTVRSEGILDDEQQTAFRIMNETRENLFITGKAGTGKSFLLDMFVRGTEKNVIVLAPTGIAALNVHGATIHSTFGYSNLEELSVEGINKSNIRLKSEKREVLKRVDTIVIDEISMVRADTFDKIDKIMRVLNENAKPFGGKQMVVFGDLFQLPPVAKRPEQQFLTDYYGGIFFFNSNAYGNGRFGFIELTTNHRQKEDKEFFNILNRMREGSITQVDLDHLNQRYVSDRNVLRRVMTLFPKKADAEKLNKEELSKIEAREYVYQARVVFNAYKNKTANLEANFPITEELHLKRGALVMMVANDPNKKWVNGTIGIVHSLYEDAVKVTIDGTTYDVPRMAFRQREASYVKGRIEYEDVLCVEQFPIVLAYAITIHKSQGMTYKQIACDISQCFAPGQAYVALSRCSTMSGLYLIKEVYRNMIQTNMPVVDFYRSQSTEETVKRFS